MKTVIDKANDEVGYLGKASFCCLSDKTSNPGKIGYSKYWSNIFAHDRNRPFCTAFIYWIFRYAYGMKNARAMLFCYREFVPEPYRLEERFKKKKRYGDKPYLGSIIFLKQYNCTDHVGIIVELTDDGFFSVEGNVINEDGIPCVARCFHRLDENSISGYGYPKYSLLLEKQR